VFSLTAPAIDDSKVQEKSRGPIALHLQRKIYWLPRLAILTKWGLCGFSMSFFWPESNEHVRAASQKFNTSKNKVNPGAQNSPRLMAQFWSKLFCQSRKALVLGTDRPSMEIRCQTFRDEGTPGPTPSKCLQRFNLEGEYSLCTYRAILRILGRIGGAYGKCHGPN